MPKPSWLSAALVLAVLAAAQFSAAADQVLITTGDGQALAVTSDAIAPAASPAAGPPVKPPDSRSEPGKPGDTQSKPGEAKDEPDKEKEKGDAEKEAKEEPKPPEPIPRPSQPPQPPDPKELEVRPGADGKIRFNFNGQPWEGVLQWLADTSGMSLDWQELPGDFLNLTTQRGYTLDETRDLVNRHLLVRGYTLLRHAEVLSVVKLEKLNPGMVPRVEPEELDARDPHEFVKVSFALDWLLAETAVEELKPMLSSFGKLNPLAATNRVEAIDAVVNLREIRQLLVLEQSVEAEERLFEEFSLQYAKAEEVREQLLGLLGIESKPKTAAPMSPDQMRQMQEEAQRQAQMQQQQQKGAAPPRQKEEPKVAIVVNARRNSVLVQAPPDKMVIIRQAVAALDVPTGAEESLLLSMHRMQVYRLAALDPEPLVKTLLSLGDLDPRTRLEVDKPNRAVIAFAPVADHVMIRAVIEQLDGSGRRFEVIPLRRLAADYVAGTIQFMMAGGEEDKSRSSRYVFGYGPSRESSEQSQDRFAVDADVEHNRLLLRANEIEIEEVRNLLVKLGEIPPEGGGDSRLRVIEGAWGPQTQEWLERVQRAWPSVAPNPLVLPPAEPQPSESGDEPQDQTPEPEKPSLDVLRAAVPRAKSPPAALLRLAQLVDDDPAGTAAADAAPLPSQPSAPTFQPQAATAPPPSAPVQITRGPDGRIVITSDDTRALDLLEDLMNQLAPPRVDFKIFRLKYAWAYGVALTLEEIFAEEEKESQPRYPWYYWDYNDRGDEKDDRLRLSKRRPLKFISDPDSNSILVQNADPQQLAKIEELIEFYDQPEPIDSQSVRKSQIFQLRYAKAVTVADAVKDLYRDLLSANDKALANAQQRQSARESYTFVYDSGDGEQQERAPRFKGLLSIGINELSNTLVVSAPMHLLEDVSELIESLDEAAKPTAETVEVLHVGEGLNIEEVRQKLNRLMGQGRGGSDSRESPRRSEPSRPGDQPSQRLGDSEGR